MKAEGVTFKVRCGSCRRVLAAGETGPHYDTDTSRSFDVHIGPHRPGTSTRVHSEPFRQSWSFDCRCGKAYRVGPEQMGQLVRDALTGDRTLWMDA